MTTEIIKISKSYEDLLEKIKEEIEIIESIYDGEGLIIN
jgi:hypothetical protein